MTDTIAAPAAAEPVIAAAAAAANAPTPAAPPVADAKPAESKPEAKVSLLGDAKAPETKPADAKPAEAKAEAPYELKVPEGSDGEIAKDFAKLGKEHKVPLEALQKAYDGLGQKMAQRHEQRLDSLYDEWAEAAKSDKEIGGEKFSENLGIAKAAIVKFGGEPLLQLLLGANGRNPLGANPDMLRAWVRVGRAIADDKLVTGGAKAGLSENEKWAQTNQKTVAGLRAMGVKV
jgi:hypothetical protein